MTQDNRVIYVGGDSFTAGEDITDYLLPGYRAYSSAEIQKMSFEEIEEKQIFWINHRRAYYLNKNIFDEHVRIKDELRWSNVLDKLVAPKVINMSSIGGSSMYAIAYRAAYDLHVLKKNGYEVTDVILQLTNANRYSFFTEKEYEFHGSRIPYRICSVNLSSSMAKNLTEAFAEHETQQLAIYRLFYEIYQADKMIESVLGKKPIFVDSIFFNGFLRNTLSFFDVMAQLDGFIYDYSLELKERLKLSMLDCVNGADEKVWTASSHLDKEIHNRFGHRIYEEYFKNG